jgi:hypothetical protein
MDFNPLSQFIDRMTSWRIPWAEAFVMQNNVAVFRYRNGFANLEEKTPIDESHIFNLNTNGKLNKTD